MGFWHAYMGIEGGGETIEVVVVTGCVKSNDVYQSGSKQVAAYQGGPRQVQAYQGGAKTKQAGC